MKTLQTALFSLLAFTLPMFVLAATFDEDGYVDGIITAIGDWVTALVPVLIALAMVVFFWGLVQYLWSGADDGKVKGKNLMIWGIIAVAVMISIWGLVGLLQSVTGVGTGSSVTIPEVPGDNTI